METFCTNFVKWFQRLKTKKFAFVGRFFIKLGISANMMTSFSLICALLSFYFLFRNNIHFVVFILFHLLADGLDGVIARESKTTQFGYLFDHFLADGTITVLMILKIGWYLHDYFAYIAGLLFAMSMFIHALSSFEAPIVFDRTITIFLIFAALLISSYATIILVSAYLLMGIVSMYSLARQLQWYLVDKI